MIKIKKNRLYLLIAFGLIAMSCKKGPGLGGQANITGKVWQERWIGTFHDSTNDHWATEQDVYIIFGDDITFGNRERTGPDGLFEFQYLRKGNYTIYVYSDSTINLKTTIKKQVDIPKKGTTDLGIFTIKKIN